MGRGRRCVRHQASGAWLVIALLLSSISCAGPEPAGSGLCAADRIDTRVRVTHVSDGDSFRAQVDGKAEKLRLIGLNTPEMGRDDRPAEALSQDARDHARALLKQSAYQVGVRYDRERRDRYGRLLVHIFLKNGDSLTARMLQAGMGAQVVVPPNDWNAACFSENEQQARRQQRGLWKLKRYNPELGRYEPQQGFAIVRGRIVDTGQSRRAWWLQLDSGIRVRVDRHVMSELAADSANWQGQQVEVRGWFRQRKHNGQSFWQVSVRHERMLRRID